MSVRVISQPPRVLTLGTFDLYHHGHQRLLERAAEYGDLTIGVNTDRFVARFKRRPPVHSTAERIAAVKAAGFWNAIENDGPGIATIIAERPDLLVIGSDWLDNGYIAQLGTDEDELIHLDVAILFLPRTPGISTTQLLEAA